MFNFSAKWDVVPSMLTQNHENVIKEFMGQTSSFNKYVIKPDVLVLGENRKVNNVRYMYGELGRGTGPSIVVMILKESPEAEVAAGEAEEEHQLILICILIHLATDLFSTTFFSHLRRNANRKHNLYNLL